MRISKRTYGSDDKSGRSIWNEKKAKSERERSGTKMEEERDSFLAGLLRAKRKDIKFKKSIKWRAFHYSSGENCLNLEFGIFL